MLSMFYQDGLDIVKTYRSNQDCEALELSGHQYYHTQRACQNCGKETKGVLRRTEGAIELLSDAIECRKGMKEGKQTVLDGMSDGLSM